MKKVIAILMAFVLLTSCAAVFAESDDDWMNEDWMDDEWKKEAIAAWAEEREAAKAFTARFSGTLTDEDLLTFVMLNDETRIILGKTTPRDLLKEGYILSSAADGVFALVSKYGEDTGVYLYTENGGNNEPIMEMDAMFQEFMEVGYCGFDGTVGIHADDPDEYWYPDETGLKLGGLLAETGERIDLWDGLVNWLVTDYGARQSEEGIYEAKITLSDGRALYVASHDSQVRISLLGPCTEVTAGMP